MFAVKLEPLPEQTLNPGAVLIVEDTPTTMTWLQEVVAEAFPEADVHCAETLSAARKILRDQHFDLALLDLGLPDGSGIELIVEIRNLLGDAPYIVVATIFDDDRHLMGALREGANGYLLKDEERDTMVDHLRGITRNQTPMSNKSLGQVLQNIKKPGEPNIKLTEREEDVLRVIAKGFSVSESAAMLGLTNNTVKSYLKTIYSKLGISSRAEATAEALKRHLIEL